MNFLTIIFISFFVNGLVMLCTTVRITQYTVLQRFTNKQYSRNKDFSHIKTQTKLLYRNLSNWRELSGKNLQKLTKFEQSLLLLVQKLTATHCVSVHIKSGCIYSINHAFYIY